MKKKHKSSKAGWRFLNHDGSINVVRRSVKRKVLTDIYHFLVSATWPGFFLSVGLIFLLANLVFSLGYFSCGPDSFRGTQGVTGWGYFQQCFFFSVQTLSTVSSATINPRAVISSVIAGVEAFAGLLILAVMTSMLYARFSRPIARILFSNVIILGTEGGKPAIIFRVANERLNDVSEAKLSVVFIRNETSEEGEDYRRLYDLKLLRNYSPIFALTWTVVHVIDSESPLKGLAPEDLVEIEAEILVTLTGIDYAFSQPLHARNSYSSDDFVQGVKFADMISRRKDGKLSINLSKINEVERLGKARS